MAGRTTSAPWFSDDGATELQLIVGRAREAFGLCGLPSLALERLLVGFQAPPALFVTPRPRRRHVGVVGDQIGSQTSVRVPSFCTRAREEMGQRTEDDGVVPKVFPCEPGPAQSSILGRVTPVEEPGALHDLLGLEYNWVRVRRASLASVGRGTGAGSHWGRTRGKVELE